MTEAPAAFAQVVVNLPLETVYTYRIPPDLVPLTRVGCRVGVRFGHQEARAVVIALSADGPAGRAARDIDDVLDPLPLLTPELLELGRWISEYYLCTLGEALDAMAPGPAMERPPARFVVPGGELSLTVLPTRARKPRELALAMIRHPAAAAGLTRDQLRELMPRGDAHLRTLVAAGVAALAPDAAPAPRAPLAPGTQGFPALTQGQAACATAITGDVSGRHARVHLVHGVTGCGKTEIYLETMRAARAAGRGAVFLLPEISLTVPMISLLRRRFGDDVALLHSALSPRDRYGEWLSIARGEKGIVVGARSAVFAPLADPGCFILDEEPEGSYKQDGKPCYHAREVARRRAATHGAPLVLGSATPSLETFHEARTGRAVYHRLTERFNRLPLPEVTLVDMSDEFSKRKNRSIFSMALKSSLAKTFEAGGQALLFLNRRGHSTYVFCRACGKPVECRDCSATLTYHMSTARMLCHLCGLVKDPPRACPECQDPSIRYAGGGTQRVEEEFRANFPHVTSQRMDSDTTSQRGSHERILEAYRTGQTRVLIGTQMVAKGFDFHNLDLVGVINADSVLHTSDFRGAEKTFQIVTQVAGRVGRGAKAGTVLVQTYSPGHYALQAAKHHDYESFAEQELPQRQALMYPPFTKLIQITAEGDSEEAPRDALFLLKDHLQRNLPMAMGVRVMGPAPARVLKVMNRFRFCLLLKIPLEGPSAAAARLALKTFEIPKSVVLRFDVDPMI